MRELTTSFKTLVTKGYGEKTLKPFDSNFDSNLDDETEEKENVIASSWGYQNFTLHGFTKTNNTQTKLHYYY